MTDTDTDKTPIHAPASEKFIELPIIKIHEEITFIDVSSNGNKVVKHCVYDSGRGICGFIMHTKDKLEQARTANDTSKIAAHEKTLKQYKKQLKNPSLFEALCDWKEAQEGTSDLARMTPQIDIDKKGIALSDIKHLQEHHSPVLGVYTTVSIKSSDETFMICGSQKQVIQNLNEFSQNAEKELDFITPWKNMAKDKDTARKIHTQSLKDIANTSPTESNSNTAAPRTLTKQVQDLFAKFGSKKEKKPPQKKKPSALPKAQK